MAAEQPEAPKDINQREPEPRLSMATENYLLSIIRLAEDGSRVTPTHLAEHLKTLPEGEGLGTSLPSVGGMIRRMVREGLVETSPSQGIVLTRRGRDSAEGMVRRHRLAERMVVDLLGLELQKAHEEAHRLEHAISKDLEEKIAAALGNPTTCPFGHPIPFSGYEPDESATSLDNAATGHRYVVDRIPEDHQPLLEYFIKNGLVPGQPVEVKEIAETRGVVTLVCGGNELVFSYDVASRVWVRPQPE